MKKTILYGPPIWFSTLTASLLTILIALSLSFFLEPLTVGLKTNGIVTVFAEIALALIILIFIGGAKFKKNDTLLDLSVVYKKPHKQVFCILVALAFYSLACLFSFWIFQNSKTSTQILKNFVMFMQFYIFIDMAIQIKRNYKIKLTEPAWEIKPRHNQT